MNREEILGMYQIEKILKGQVEIMNRLDKLLSILSQSSLSTVISPVLNIRQAAELLNVSQSSLISACRMNTIPCRRIGTNYVFEREELLNWLKSKETLVVVKESIDSESVAHLLGVPVSKVRQWAKGHEFYGIPVINEGPRFLFDKDEILKWSETPECLKLKDEYLKNSTLNKERQIAAEAKREAERQENEARRKARIERKLASKLNK
jgi:excisionase family DNA binding protein